jgi:peptidoglycan/xylan/chitin deacetylase (PgdA/CDA1 family)
VSGRQPPTDAAPARRVHVRRRLVAVGAVLAVLFMPLWIISASASKKLRSARVSSGVRAVLRGERAFRRAARGRRAVESLLAEKPVLREAPGAGREVALTFDDGPGPYTEEILDILIGHRAPATFFPVGLAIDEYPDEVRREASAGFAIGDHTQGHVKMAGLPPAEQESQLLEQAADLRRLGAPFPRLFRPPFGEYDANTLKLLRREKMLMVLWTVETADYERPGEGAILQHVLEEVHPGAIVLLHDGGGDRSETVTALPKVIEELRARGYRLVTVPQLVLDAGRVAR